MRWCNSRGTKSHYTIDEEDPNVTTWITVNRAAVLLLSLLSRFGEICTFAANFSYVMPNVCLILNTSFLKTNKVNQLYGDTGSLSTWKVSKLWNQVNLQCQLRLNVSSERIHVTLFHTPTQLLLRRNPFGKVFILKNNGNKIIQVNNAHYWNGTGTWN